MCDGCVSVNEAIEIDDDQLLEERYKADRVGSAQSRSSNCLKREGARLCLG